VIVFGWKSQGGADWSGILKCEKCHEWSMHYGVRVKRHFTLFFVPVVPLWANTKVVCSECNATRPLGAIQFAEVQHLAEVNLKLAIAARDNPDRAQELLQALVEPPWLQQPSRLALTAGPVCARCGAGPAPGDKFCPSCGSALLA